MVHETKTHRVGGFVMIWRKIIWLTTSGLQLLANSTYSALAQTQIGKEKQKFCAVRYTLVIFCKKGVYKKSEPQICQKLRN